MKPIIKKSTYLLCWGYLFLMSAVVYAEETPHSSSVPPSWNFQGNYTQPAPATHDNNTDLYPDSDIAKILKTIKDYLYNLGSYFGYDLNTNPNQAPQNTLNDPKKVTASENNVVIEAIAILSKSIIYPTLVPNDSSGSKNYLNSQEDVFQNLKNSTLDAPAIFMSGDTQVGLPPVSQLILNMLSYTPEGLCIGPDGHWKNDCTYSYNPSFIMGKILGLQMSNDFLSVKGQEGNQLSQVINTFGPSVPENFFPRPVDQNKPNPQQSLLNQLDSSIFLSPLVYDKNQGAKICIGNSDCGLSPNTQQEAAADFIRYVTGSVVPKNPPEWGLINKYITTIRSKNTKTLDQITLFKKLSSYILELRVYAAKHSVATQSLYEMYGKRVPQQGNNPDPTNSNSGPITTSQAFEEYKMATYRLSDPNHQDDTSWQSKMNNASAATVQKEMLVLLSEINYQLYQMRRQQERLLLTQSLIMINNMPAPELTDAPELNNPGQ